MIVNRKLKIAFYLTASSCFSLAAINKYKSINSTHIIDLNDIIRNNKKLKKENNQRESQLQNNPFEIIEGKSIEKDFDKIFLHNFKKCLYNTPLTNKLYPKSNLYGHELIRYFDF